MKYRTAIGLALTIPLGAAIAIATSWLASCQSTRNMRSTQAWRTRDQSRGEGDGWLVAIVGTKAAFTRTWAQATDLGTYPSEREVTAVTPELLVSNHARKLCLPWLEGLRPWPAGVIDNVFLHEYGWPFRAMYARGVSIGTSGGWSDCLILDSTKPNSTRGEVPGLPIGIVWLGFLADAAIWGAVCLVVFFAPGHLLRARRARTGRCMACGYDRSGLALDAPCPECGAPPKGSTA